MGNFITFVAGFSVFPNGTATGSQKLATGKTGELSYQLRKSAGESGLLSVAIAILTINLIF